MLLAGSYENLSLDQIYTVAAKIGFKSICNTKYLFILYIKSCYDRKYCKFINSPKNSKL